MKQSAHHGISAQLFELSKANYSVAIDSICTLERALWELSFRSEVPGGDVVWPQRAYSRIKVSDLYDRSALSSDFLELTLHHLETTNAIRRLPNDKAGVDLNVFQPFHLARTLMNGLRPDSDLRYYVMRNIRKHYECNLSHTVAHLFHALADAMNSYRVADTATRPTEWRYTRRGLRRTQVASATERHQRIERSQDIETKPKYKWHYESELLPFLQSVLEPNESSEIERAESVNLFVECCRAVGYLTPGYESAHVDVRTPNIDGAYLVSNLFGIPTRMRGFDELFGGGGLMLTETIGSTFSRTVLGGRSVLIMGRFGTGKSILSLHLAVEVARKGGAAWVMPLEQSAQECLYTLETMGALRHDNSTVIATDILAIDDVLSRQSNGKGALLISGTIKDSFSDFLDGLRENARRLKGHPLRLVCVDPINSIKREGLNSAELRAEMVSVLDEIKRDGTNVLMVAEAGSKAASDLLFEQNIADTVINLTVDKEHGYAARYFEIQKSRLQREQRGLHPFSIVPGSGVRIYASSAAVTARMRPRAVAGKEPIEFGMASLDDILGEASLTWGDIVVFQGEGGSFKTPLGLIFLLGINRQPKHRKQLPVRSLLLSARDDESSIRYMLEQEFIKTHIGHKLGQLQSPAKSCKTIDEIIICSLPHGYIHPGNVFQRIEDEINEARLSGYVIDRIMIDDIAHWEMSSPFIASDETFGDTLIDFLHRHGLTGLLVCGPAAATSSVIQKSIVDGSDCLIEFNRIDFRGSNRVMLQVLKTRGMHHRRESFEVTLGRKSLDVRPTSSLLRAEGGETRPVTIRLFLNSATPMRQQYNKRTVDALSCILSENTYLAAQEQLTQGRILSLGRLSAVDELQVIQLDEFHLPSVRDISKPEFPLYRFSPNQLSEESWGEFLPKLSGRVRANDGSFFAVPFYENVSLMAYRREFEADVTSLTWEILAAECKRWESANRDQQKVFFDFPKSTPENYNSLFLEILLGTANQETGIGLCRLEEILATDAAIHAGLIYRQLCRRPVLISRTKDVVRQMMQPKRSPVVVNKNALVWRHWYTSLNQMVSSFSAQDRDRISVSALPGGSSIAGEWYLGVTPYSAAPDVGLQVIKYLANHEAELDRLQIGIGLPTRRTFYNTNEQSYVSGAISPYAPVDRTTIEKLINTAYRRSDFGCYSQLAPALAHHLQRIIALPDNETTLDKGIRGVFGSLISHIQFIGTETLCTACTGGRGSTPQSQLPILRNPSKGRDNVAD